MMNSTVWEFFKFYKDIEEKIFDFFYEFLAFSVIFSAKLHVFYFEWMTIRETSSTWNNQVIHAISLKQKLAQVAKEVIKYHKTVGIIIKRIGQREQSDGIFIPLKKWCQ